MSQDPLLVMQTVFLYCQPRLHVRTKHVTEQLVGLLAVGNVRLACLHQSQSQSIDTRMYWIQKSVEHALKRIIEKENNCLKL